MKIKISNFGPIKKFEYDLSKDLIVAYGKNNMGKSYAMSVVYLLLKHFLNINNLQLTESSRKEMDDKKKQSHYRAIEKEILEKKECNITKRINNIIKNIFNKVLSSSLENSFKNTFGELISIKNFKGKDTPLISLDLPNYIIHFSIGRSLRVTKFSSKREAVGRLVDDGTGLTVDKAKYVLKIQKNGFDFLTLLQTFVDDRIRYFIESIREKIEDIYFLPASRSGLYAGSESFFPIFAELSKSRPYITKKIDLPAISEPIADYFLRLSEIDTGRSKNKNLHAVACDMEKNILKGEIGFDDNRNRLFYSPEDSDLNLGMNVVSSMVSELSPVVAFIKFILGKNRNGKNSYKGAKPFIFIEEPEAHLHPEVQVQLVEIFLKLIEADVKLIISSHSNYIFNKLSNMVIAGTLELHKYAPIILMDTDKGSESRLMELDDLGVEDENFIDIADALYEERERILDIQNKGFDDQQNQV